MAFGPDTQQGATIAFTGLATFINAAIDIPEIQQTGGAIDVTHLGTTTQRRYIGFDLIDTPEFTVRFQHDSTTALPLLNTVYTVTVTGPVKPGGSTGEIQAGTCIVTSIPSGPQFQSETPAIQVSSITLKPDGSGSGGGTAWTRTAGG